MTWEQKLQALGALTSGVDGVVLGLRKPGDWYAYLPRAEVKDRSILSSPSGQGKTPEEAVEELWRNYASLPPGQCVVVNAFSDKRREVRWNGFMWQEMPK